MNKQKSKLLVLAGVSAVAFCGLLKGSGFLNRFAYKKQHEAVSRYVDAHYKGAAFSPVQKTEHGFITIVTMADGKRIALTFTEADKDIFVFSETPL
ncbi:MAG: hypothetical protein J6N52_10340 [Clostridia bacterium]|nr:hypothetical protein [Clostridia bacterium]